MVPLDESSTLNIDEHRLGYKGNNVGSESNSNNSTRMYNFYH